MAQTGILIESSTITGSVVDAGTIDATGAGIKIDSNAKLLGAGTALDITASILIGGVSNAGIIDAKVGVDVTSAHDVNVFDDGTIIGSGGTAVEFKAAGNDFTLGAGYVVSGAVVGVAGDALQLGGAAAANFNLAAVGTQYKGFSEFNVVGGTWTVSGSGGHWSVEFRCRDDSQRRRRAQELERQRRRNDGHFRRRQLETTSGGAAVIAGDRDQQRRRSMASGGFIEFRRRHRHGRRVHRNR